MSIRDEKYINVRNINNFVVTAKSQLRSYTFPPEKDGVDVKIPMTWEEIVYINTNSNVFRNGTLTFEEDKIPEIMDELHNFEYEKIMSNEEFEDIILNPTAEGLNKILKINDLITLERVRGVLYSLKNADVDVSSRVERMIDSRFKELIYGKRTTSISVTPESHKKDRKDQEIENLNAKLEDMQNKVDALMSMLQGKSKQAENSSVNTDSEILAEANVKSSKEIKAPATPVEEKPKAKKSTTKRTTKKAK